MPPRRLALAFDRATQVGASTVIDLGNGDSLKLVNVYESTLAADDFLI